MANEYNKKTTRQKYGKHAAYVAFKEGIHVGAVFDSTPMVSQVISGGS
jgi:hypothetical protein